MSISIISTFDTLIKQFGFEHKNLQLFWGLAILFAIPGIALLNGVLTNNNAPRLEQEIVGDFLKETSEDYPNQKSIKILAPVDHDAHNDQLRFYMKQLKYHGDWDIMLMDSITQVHSRDTFLTCNEKFHHVLNDDSKEFEIIKKDKSCFLATKK